MYRMAELSQAHTVFLSILLLSLQNPLVCVVAKHVHVMTVCFGLCVAGHSHSYHIFCPALTWDSICKVKKAGSPALTTELLPIIRLGNRSLQCGWRWKEEGCVSVIP